MVNKDFHNVVEKNRKKIPGTATKKEQGHTYQIFILSVVMLSTLRTNLLTFPHWESLSAAYKESISPRLCSLEPFCPCPTVVIVYFIRMLCIHV